MKQLKGFMHGINLGGWLSQCSEYTESHYNSFIKEDDIRNIADWGLDHVRLPIDYNVIEDENLRNRFLSLWKTIALRYGKVDITAFELLNEITKVPVTIQSNSHIIYYTRSLQT